MSAKIEVDVRQPSIETLRDAVDVVRRRTLALASPLEIESADNVRRIVDRMEGNHRLLVHGRVNPNQPGDIEDMPRLRWP